jgi:hypothetical protein
MGSKIRLSMPRQQEQRQPPQPRRPVPIHVALSTPTPYPRHPLGFAMVERGWDGTAERLVTDAARPSREP